MILCNVRCVMCNVKREHGTGLDWFLWVLHYTLHNQHYTKLQSLT